MRGEEMRRFWDERATEDAFYFVDNRLEYGLPDAERFWAQGRRDLDTLLELAGVEVKPQDVLVEIGCGIGRITRELAARATRIEAIDVSERMLELARRHNDELTNVRWLLGDGESLAAVEDASADGCFSHVVFQHIPDPSLTLGYVAEMGRVLRGGGWAAFQVSNEPRVHRHPGRRERLTATMRARLGRAPRGQSHPAWRGSAVDLHDLAAAARGAGMDVERMVGAGTQFCVVRLRKRHSR